MTDFILMNEGPIRLGFFIGAMTLFGLWEIWAPRRKLQYSKLLRWANNLGLVFVNTLVIRLVFPFLAVGLAVSLEKQGWGLIPMLGWPAWANILVAVVVMDLTIYIQHVMVHSLPLLWRLHRLHHADLDYDVTTGARFHPLEIVLSMGIKLGVVFLLGAPPVAVVIFEVILNAAAIFNHGNIRLPLALDRVLRKIIVTPDMHRVHHSTLPNEANSNFGFNLPWWDYLFGTYRSQPKKGHTEMEIGISQFRASRFLWLDALLIQPFLGKEGTYSINRKE